MVKYDWDIQYVMEVRHEHDNYLVVEQVTTNLCKSSGLKVA